MIVREKLLMGEEQPPETRKTTIGPEDASGMPIRQKIAFKREENAWQLLEHLRCSRPPFVPAKDF
jgi:hypothetical protein